MFLHKVITESLIVMLRAFRIGVFILIDSVCFILPSSKSNIAIIVRLDAIGDFFVWLQSGALNVTRYARETGCRTVLLANRIWADYARTMGLWDQVIDVEPALLMRSPIYRMKLMWKVRRMGAKLLIQPRAARIFLQEDAIARISGASNKIGSDGVLFNTTPFLKRLGDQYYDRLISVSQDMNVHETIRNGEFVLSLTERAPTKFELESLHSGPSMDAVAIAIGAGWVGRVWPIEKLAGLVKHIMVAHPSWKVVLLGSEADRYLAEQLEQLVGVPLDNQIGKTTLHAFVEIIARSRLVICNESSAYHIAVALNHSVMCFVGGGHFGWFAPYPSSDTAISKARVLTAPMACFSCNWQCKYPRANKGPVLCIDSIQLQTAIESLDTMLESAHPN